MFTGIIAEAGIVEAIDEHPQSIRLVVRCRLPGIKVKTGDSVAVNGCCLTTVKAPSANRNRLLHFDLLRETWQRTNLQHVKAGSLVNLELPLLAASRLDGHFVTGHIDGFGKITRWEQVGADRLLEISAPAEIMRYIVFKGSIALDGISLTVAAVKKKSFQVWIIPHTCKVTALCERQVGDFVNLETDILGKYVEKFLGKPVLI
jgi:riboflavin synthase